MEKLAYPIIDCINLSHMDIDEIAKKTDIPRSTLYRRLKNPDSIRLWELREINRVCHFTNDQANQLIRG